ncbi:hypothetical protein H0H93_016289 [Arthromyces matolae]|nr:hypothetical protein H0H93_016289 [Arthromyces matolae]
MFKAAQLSLDEAKQSNFRQINHFSTFEGAFFYMASLGVTVIDEIIEWKPTKFESHHANPPSTPTKRRGNPSANLSTPARTTPVPSGYPSSSVYIDLSPHPAISIQVNGSAPPSPEKSRSRVSDIEAGKYGAIWDLYTSSHGYDERDRILLHYAFCDCGADKSIFLENVSRDLEIESNHGEFIFHLMTEQPLAICIGETSKNSDFNRLLSAARYKSSHQTKTPWRTRTKRADDSIKRTIAKRAANRKARAEEKEKYQTALMEAQQEVRSLAEKLRTEFGKHSVDYYEREILQLSRQYKNRKDTGAWNAFVSMEVKRRNALLPADVPKKKANDYMSEISAAWNKLSQEERTEMTKDTVDTLRETNEMRQVARHNVPIASFNDFRATMENVGDELLRLNARTGAHALAVVVRGDREQYNRPFVLITSQRVNDFMDMTLQLTAEELGERLEAFMLSGVQGVKRNYIKDLAQKRSLISAIISTKLKETASTDVARMLYSNFDNITEKYGLVIKNWPLPKFQSPSEISSRVELDMLLNAWQSGTTHFYKLSKAEYDAWSDARFQSATESVPRDDTAANSQEPSTATAASQNSPSDDADGQPSPDEPPTVAPSSSTTDPSPAPGLSTSNFINVVSGQNGSLISITKKARKPRKDKGVPRKKRRPANDENIQEEITSV